MSQQDVDTVRSAYEAFGRQDIPGVLDTLGDDIQWDVPDSLPFGGVFHGREEVTSFFGSIGDYYDELRVEPDEFLEAGDRVVALGNHHGKVKDGGTFDVRFAMVWTMRDGKAASFKEYTDTAPIDRALQAQATA
jgi:ketosteroid isomerase-like protein